MLDNLVNGLNGTFQILIYVFLFMLGAFLLVQFCDLFLDSASSIAKKFNVSAEKILSDNIHHNLRSIHSFIIYDNRTWDRYRFCPLLHRKEDSGHDCRLGYIPALQHYHRCGK